MEDKVLTRNAYSLMFLVLAVWSFIPYILPGDTSLMVFNKFNLSIEVCFIVVSLVAAHGTFYAKSHGFLAGQIAIISTIMYIGLNQVALADSNLPLSTVLLRTVSLLTILLIYFIFSAVFKPENSFRRQRHGTIELNLETGI